MIRKMTNFILPEESSGRAKGVFKKVVRGFGVIKKVVFL